MNPAQVIGVLCCLGTLATVVVAFEVGVFRLACALCRVPMPPHGRTLGLVMTLLVVPAIVDAVFSGLLYEVYKAMRAPLWEAGVVQFFLALPAHMAICSLLHARFMSLPLADGLAVWLVEKLIKLGLVSIAVTVVGAIVLVGKLVG